MKDHELRRRLTDEAFNDPQVGDRFHEMFSFWVYVVYIFSTGEIVTMEGSPPCTFPTSENIKIRVYKCKHDFKSRFEYKTMPGYTVDLRDRENDVSWWLQHPKLEGVR